jgi:signal transduction histidine kinase
MLLELANQTRVPAHVVHAVLRQNPSVAALLRVAPIAVDAAPQVLLVGDRPRLERVLRTVLGYVAARSPAGATVQVTVQAQRDAVTIGVQEGDGPLPAPEQERGQKGWPRAQAAGPAAVAGLDPELASARRIVEQHGGHLRLAQARGQDVTATTILLTLPRAQAWHDEARGAHGRMPRAAS